MLCLLFSKDALRRRLSYLLPMGHAEDLDVDITVLFNDWVLHSESSSRLNLSVFFALQARWIFIWRHCLICL